MRQKLLTAMLCAAFSAAPAFAGPVEDMMAADAAFAEMAQTDGVAAAFAAYADENVRMFPAGGAPYSGRAKLAEQFADWPAGARLEWTPVEGFAAASGDFGFTWGRYVYTPPAEGESPAAANHGKYVSIWRKQADGSWKFIADIGNSNPAPEGGE